MLAISPLESSSCHDGRGGGAGDVMEDYSAVVGGGDDNFSNAFSDGGLLEDIDFDDLFVGFDEGDDVLPDLEVDPNEIHGEFSMGSGGEESGTTSSAELKSEGSDRLVEIEKNETDDAKDSDQTVPDTTHDTRLASTSSMANSLMAAAASDKDRKSAVASAKNLQGKRKVKVDWTPELHRRFVQAVEQLGVDKAVPSRILEIMGIDCLTRHNIASHLQKYRSHRKHLMAREAEAASWSQRRQMYGGATGHSGQAKREMTAPWLIPTIGFPPPPPPVQTFRPLHVWGHPTVDHAMMHMWPKHLVRPSPPHQWNPQLHAPAPPADPSFWHHPHYSRGPREGWMPTPGTPCFSPQTFSSQVRFPTQPVPGILPPTPPPPHPMYRPDNTVPLHGKQLQLDLHPSKESIDAAIGDVLSKPWLPLPLGLKPPSVDSVLVELQRQGIAKVPPSCA